MIAVSPFMAWATVVLLGTFNLFQLLELPIFTPADSNQPGRATHAEPFTLPITLHHPRVRG